MLMVVGLVLCVVSGALGRGFLLDTPARSNMWREGSKTPRNVKATSLNCGGFGGKCGVCGDPLDQSSPRENKAGGKYAKGIITRTHRQRQNITLTVVVTANHKGYFEFRLCRKDDTIKVATQDCLDEHVLYLNNASGTKYHLLGHLLGNVKLIASLPAEMTCSQCVLRWKWTTESNYEAVDNNHSCSNCMGPEEFYACSDIAVSSSGSHGNRNRPGNAPVQQDDGTSRKSPNSGPTRATGHGSFDDCRGTGLWGVGVIALDNWCVLNCYRGFCPSRQCQCPTVSGRVPSTPKNTVVTTQLPMTLKLTTSETTKRTKQIDGPSRLTGHGIFDRCRGFGLWAVGVIALDNWCVENCAKGYCPALQCRCPDNSSSAGSSSTFATPPHHAQVAITKLLPSQGTPSSGPFPTPSQHTIKTPTNAPLGTPSRPFVATPSRVPLETQSPAPTQTPTTAIVETSTTVTVGKLTRAPVAVGVGSFGLCHGVNNWRGIPELDAWCKRSCSLNYCPKEMCDCSRIV